LSICLCFCDDHYDDACDDGCDDACDDGCDDGYDVDNYISSDFYDDVSDACHYHVRLGWQNTAHSISISAVAQSCLKLKHPGIFAYMVGLSEQAVETS